MGEPRNRSARVPRGPVSMNKSTHIASSSEASPRVEINPPEERAAPMPEDAPPPIGLLRGRTWGSASSGDDDAASYATSGPDNPDWPEAHPQWAHGRDHPQGLDAAAWTAASPVGFPNRREPRGAHRRETSRRTTHPTGLTARTDSKRTRGERTSSSTTPGGWIQRHGLRHRPWVPYRGEPRGTHRRETPRQITQPRGWAARRGHGPAGQPTVTAVRALRAKSGFAAQGRTLLQACTRHMTPRRPSARVTVPATGHETTARSGITMRAGAPRHRRAMRRTARTRRGCPRVGTVAAAEPIAPDASCPGRRRPDGHRARRPCPPHVQAPGATRGAQVHATSRLDEPTAADCGKGGRHGWRSPLRQGRLLRRLGRHVPRARETGGPHRARVDTSGGQAPPCAARGSSGQVASASPRGPRPRPRAGDKDALRHDRERHREDRHRRHPGGGGARAAARAPPRGRWGPRRKPRAPHPQRASHPAPRGRAISASKRGRAHRR